MIGRFGRTARGWAKRGAALASFALLLVAAEMAWARPYTVDTGPIPEGDPTADDQPSPTPKSRSARFGGWSTPVTQDRTDPASRIAPSRMTWELYLKILSRLTLR